MPKPRTHRKPAKRDIRQVKRGVASDAIGALQHGQDVYILTYGQFSLIDALDVILTQTGPADVVLSSWTAADAHLQHATHLMEALSIQRFRMIVDRSFRTRQPAYFRRMRDLFGVDCIREITSHAKFMTITNDRWNVVVRTSMNLNENPRFENIEITDDPTFAAFMLNIVDDIFDSVPPDHPECNMPDIPDSLKPFKLINAPVLETDNLTIPETTHVA
jgi:hypothetical protein